MNIFTNRAPSARMMLDEASSPFLPTSSGTMLNYISIQQKKKKKKKKGKNVF